MELEELQLAWEHMGQELDKQKKITNDIIMKMTQEKFKNKFRTISFFETFGAIICFVTAIFIVINFYKLDTWYLMLCGIITLIYLLVLPVLVLKSLFKLKNMNIIGDSFANTLKKFLKEKNRLLLWQKIAMASSFVQLFAVAIVFAKILSNKDFFLVTRTGWQYAGMAFSVLCVLIMVLWVGRGYKKLTRSAEQLIRELE